MSKKILIGGVAVVTVLLFVLMIKEKSSTNQVDGGPSPGDATQSIELIVNQQLVGTKATVAKVRLLEPGYVVVREMFGNKLGQIIEVSDYLEAGVYTDVEINFFDVPNDEADVIAVLYRDNGDQGFSSNLDSMITIGGVPVARSFSTGAPVLVEVFTSEIDLAQIPDENITYVSYTDAGYSPAVVEIKLGDTVVFENESSRDMWAASDPHPAHTNLPTFDQFGFSKPGERYQYTFDQIGVWQYHDHINPSAEGTVIVQ